MSNVYGEIEKSWNCESQIVSKSSQSVRRNSKFACVKTRLAESDGSKLKSDPCHLVPPAVHSRKYSKPGVHRLRELAGERLYTYKDNQLLNISTNCTMKMCIVFTSTFPNDWYPDSK